MLASLLHVPFPVDDPRKDLGAAEVEADDAFFVQTARLPYWLDADGREALPRLPGRTHQGQGPAGAPGAGTSRPERTAARVNRRSAGRAGAGAGSDGSASASLVLLVLATVWGIAGYLSFRSGVEKANARLDKCRCRPSLANQNGLLLSKPTTMLLLGRDHENTDQRVGLNNSDSIMILRTDPSRHRLVVSVDPARPARPDSRPRRGQDQLGVPAGRRGADDPDDPEPHRARRSTT